MRIVMSEYQKQLLEAAYNALHDAETQMEQCQADIQRIKDMPRLCMCDPKAWFGPIANICWTFVPLEDDEAVCETCGHLQECHRVDEQENEASDE